MTEIKKEELEKELRFLVSSKVGMECHIENLKRDLSECEEDLIHLNEKIFNLIDKLKKLEDK